MYVRERIQFWIQVNNLVLGKRTARFININTSHSLWPITHEWIVTRIVKAVGLLMVLKNIIIIIILPVNTIRPYVFNLFIAGMDASRAVLDHAKKKHITGTSLAFTPDSDRVVVPWFGPQECIFIDGTKEKVMKEPYVSVRVTVKILLKLKVLEEKFPLCPKRTRQIAPEPLNANIMDTSTQQLSDLSH
jgi:hypothetical protein